MKLASDYKNYCNKLTFKAILNELEILATGFFSKNPWEVFKYTNFFKSLIIMKRPDLLAPACRHCRHYVPEGRRGGNCGQLNALVQGSWKACSLALPVFSPNWQLERMMVLQNEPSEELPIPTSKSSDVRHELRRESEVSSLEDHAPHFDKTA